MEPEQKKRFLKIVSQVVMAVLGISLVYAWGLNREHTTFANVGFCASILVLLAVYLVVVRKYR